jgi:hypothetical protein
MSLLGATILTAVATVVLAFFAFATAILAGLAFLKQSREVRAVERQVTDGQEVAAQQAELLKVQAGQLEVLRGQLEIQRDASAAQAGVLELQSAELRESLEERKRGVEDRHRGQAARVTAWFGQHAHINGTLTDWGAIVRNASDLPVFDVRISFDWIYDQPGGRDWIGISYGSLPGPVTIVPPDTTRHFRFRPRSGNRTPGATTRSTRSASRSPTPQGTAGSATLAER